MSYFLKHLNINGKMGRLYTIKIKLKMMLVENI